MRYRTGAVFLVLAAAVAVRGAAGADCGAPPEAPELPSGATAEPEEMRMARAAIDAYVKAMDAYADCLEAARRAAIEERNRVVQAWNTEVEAFDARRQPQ